MALVRGINVGGKNLIKMDDLKRAFLDGGFDDVSTYIQSGNVLFSSREPDAAQLAAQAEKALTRCSGANLRVAVRSRTELERLVSQRPPRFGEVPEKYRYDVAFLMPPLTAQEAHRSLQPREGVDTVDVGESALYLSRLIARASQSRLSRVAQLPIYGSMTIRNWNTTTKLLELLSGA